MRPHNTQTGSFLSDILKCLLLAILRPKTTRKGETEKKKENPYTLTNNPGLTLDNSFGGRHKRKRESSPKRSLSSNFSLLHLWVIIHRNITKFSIIIFLHPSPSHRPPGSERSQNPGLLLSLSSGLHANCLFFRRPWSCPSPLARHNPSPSFSPLCFVPVSKQSQKQAGLEAAPDVLG